MEKKRRFDYADRVLGFVSSHLQVFAIIFVCILVGILAMAISSYYVDKKLDKMQVKLYEFTTTSFTKYQSGSIDATTFMSDLEKLEQEIDFDGFNIFLLTVSRTLQEKNEKELAIKVLEKMKGKLPKESDLKYFVNNNLAALYEDQNNLEMAKNVLEEMKVDKFKLLGGKLYLDLGRVYLKLGDNEEAGRHFDHITRNFADGYFDRMAKAYLRDMN